VPNTPLYDEIQELAAQYPVRRSAIMPALHAAQKQYGWLSPEALQEVADALDLTPAYCQAVASFYDMYHLQPIGRHMVELDIRAGDTTDDGEFTLRTLECAGGCGWGTVVSIDHRYREPVKPEDVHGIVEELRGR
jgi:NADH-quinone oxidoreductase subunit E